jgi:Asp-tRNA(Asn)/Glu-tRNA(Gln) amidotransferase A subunit family amidase
MFMGSPTRDTLGPITRTVRDAAILTGVIAGYDPNDPVTARSVGNVPESYTAFLREDALEGARLGVIRTPMSDDTDPDSEDYAQVRTVVDRAIAEFEAGGAEIVDSLEIAGLVERLREAGSNHETETAVDAYLAELDDPPVQSLVEIAVSDELTARRRHDHIGSLNRTTDEPAYLESQAVRERLRIAVLAAMAEHGLDALVYSTFDHSPALIPPDVLTNPDASDDYGKGSNRGLSPALGFPALTVPAGFTSDGFPVGIEFLGRPFSEGILFGLGYAYEQATMHRRPPASTPAL